jgi:hypothetical protein
MMENWVRSLLASGLRNKVIFILLSFCKSYTKEKERISKVTDDLDWERGNVGSCSACVGTGRGGWYTVYGPYIRAAYHLLFPVLVQFRAVAKRGVTAVGGGGQSGPPTQARFTLIRWTSNTADLILSLVFLLCAPLTILYLWTPKKDIL